MTSHLWNSFALRWDLTSSQLEKFQRYYGFLSKVPFNVTALHSLEECITYHFDDALMASKVIDFFSLTRMADVGSGNGVPGIPLVIKYPHLSGVLIEVQDKKRQFLETVSHALSLSLTTSSLDWRTFLRKSDGSIDLFCARASVEPLELIRIFKPSSPYQNSELLYWASAQWQAIPRIAPYIASTFPYKIGPKKRVLVHFKKVSHDT